MNKESIITMSADTGGKQADLEVISSVFLRDVLGPIVDVTQAMEEAVNKAKEKTTDAVNAYNADLDARLAGIQAKKQELQKKVESCQQRIEEATADLGTALSADDEGAEGKAKQAIEDASVAEYAAKRRMEALSRARITGNPELYYQAIAAYSDAYAKTRAAQTASCALKALIDELVEKLDAARRHADGLGDNPYRERGLMRKVWPMVESFGGPVDFTHATAGDDDGCKLRFLRAMATREPDEGFINSPAGPRLALDIDLMIEHEENQDS